MMLVKFITRHLCFTSPGLIFVRPLLIGAKNRGKKGFVKTALYDRKCVKAQEFCRNPRNPLNCNLFGRIMQLHCAA